MAERKVVARNSMSSNDRDQKEERQRKWTTMDSNNKSRVLKKGRENGGCEEQYEFQ